MARAYRMKKRAAAQDETRERILRATMALHDEHGVAGTTFADVAARAGVGAATVLRHFPTLGALVMACGQHVAQEMRPPSPDDAARVFEGATTRDERLDRLIAELDAFYLRGETRLVLAGYDRFRVPELDGFLRMVEAGVAALVREAVGSDTRHTGVAMALCDLAVWRRVRDIEPDGTARRQLLAAMILGALEALP